MPNRPAKPRDDFFYRALHSEIRDSACWATQQSIPDSSFFRAFDHRTSKAGDIALAAASSDKYFTNSTCCCPAANWAADRRCADSFRQFHRAGDLAGSR